MNQRQGRFVFFVAAEWNQFLSSSLILRFFRILSLNCKCKTQDGIGSPRFSNYTFGNLNTLLEPNECTRMISSISMSFQSVLLQRQHCRSLAPLKIFLIGVIAILVGRLVLLNHYPIGFATLATYHYCLQKLIFLISQLFSFLAIIHGGGF